jgi:hypothetical protein
MTLDDLDRALTRWADKFYLSPYALRKDTQLMIMLLQEYDRESIEEYLRQEYREHFAEIEEQD